MAEVAPNEISDLLITDTALVGVINGMGDRSLFDMVLLEETDNVEVIELTVVVNAMLFDVMEVVAAPSELYEFGTELTDVLMDVAVVYIS